LLTASNSTVDQDESQMEKEAGSPPQAQEKKDEGQIVSCAASTDIVNVADHLPSK
jgi:hypothetical protein